MMKAWINRNDAPLRREPHHEAEVLRQLPVRTEVEILEQDALFAKVRPSSMYPEITGYIANGFLDMGQNEAQAPTDKYAHLLPCPRCAATRWRSFPLYQTGGLWGIRTGFMRYAKVRVRVCMHCGYLEYCVDEDDLPLLEQYKEEY